MTQPGYGETFRGNPAENYHRYFVPTIGAPMAEDLLEVARLADKFAPGNPRGAPTGRSIASNGKWTAGRRQLEAMGPYPV